jgi:peptide/nickel transport system substrate-binding protein
MLQAIGATDPALSLGVEARYGCGQPFSGLCDPTVDQLLTEGASTTNTAARAKDYHQVFGLLAKDASGPMLFATPLFYTASDTSVTGLGAKTENSADVNWATVNVR